MNKSRKVVMTTKGEVLFNPNLAIYVNRIKESFDLSEHNHDFVEICYVGEGTGTHYIENQTINVKKGDLFYIPVGVSHIFRPATTSAKDSLIVYNCIFREPLFDFLQNGAFPHIDTLQLAFFKQRLTSWRQFKELNHEFHHLFAALLLEHDLKPLGYEAMLHTLFIQLLLQLERHTAGGQDHLDSAVQRIDTAVSYMLTHLHEQLTLGSISASMNIGERQLQRLIKKATGQTFIQWLQGERIQKSCELLKQTTCNISEIAQQVGFQDLKHFHRLFKDKTGVSPGQYRKTL